jgi:hypothetical protein
MTNRVVPPAQLAAAIVISAFAAVLAHSWKLPQVYAEMIAGRVSFSFANKWHDSFIIYATIGAFLVSFWYLHNLRSRLFKPLAYRFDILLAISVIPTMICFSYLIMFTYHDVLGKMMILTPVISTGAILAVTVLVLLFIGPAKISETETVETLTALVLLPCLLALDLFAIASAVWRLSPGAISGWPVGKVAIALAILGLVLSMVVLWWRNPAATRFVRLLAIIQFPLLLFILQAIPTPWNVEGKLRFGYPTNSNFKVLMVVILFFGAIDIWRRVKRVKIDSHLSEVFSSFCLVGVLLFIRQHPFGDLQVGPDDFHLGEYLLPWWTTHQFGFIPFWDYEPSRGLINYLPGFLGWAFFDGSAPAILNASQGLMTLFVYLAVFPIFRKAIGPFVAFLLLLFFPLPSDLRPPLVSSIYLLLTAALCLIAVAFKKQSPLLPMLWLAISPLMILFASGQGAIWIFATAPIVMLSLIQQWQRGNLREAIKPFCFTLILLSVIIVISPIGKMLFGSIRYGVEQSSVNAIAYGIPWSFSWGKVTDVNPLLREIIRAVFIFVVFAAGALLIVGPHKLNSAKSRETIVYRISSILLIVGLVIYAAGRIDPGGPSRLGVVSCFAVTLLLPLILDISSSARVGALLIWALSLGLVIEPVLGEYYQQIPYYKGVNAHALAALNVNTQKLTPTGLHSVDQAILEPKHYKRLEELKHTLDKVLNPNETYLDLTNRNADYFYLDRQPPIQSGAFYNIPAESQQIRAIERLKNVNPPLVLLWADSVWHDGKSPALDTPLLFRACLTEYMPAKVGNFLWLVRPDRAARLRSLSGSVVPETVESGLALLDEKFDHISLEQLPASWGTSAKTLEKSMTPAIVTLGNPSAVQGAKASGQGNFTTTEGVTVIELPLKERPIDGTEAGILDLKLSLRGCHDALVELAWGLHDKPSGPSHISFLAGGNDRLLVPLDCSPRWLLAKGITKLKLTIHHGSEVKGIELHDGILRQRTAVAKMESR